MGPISLRSQFWLKRPFDFAFSIIVLVVSAPLLAAIGLAVWISSPGPIFFRQTRVGAGGRLFTIFKFRTMHASANPYDLTPESDDTDARVTPIGRLLRKSGLDELPQFYNVVRGEMSVVGPRPEMPFLVEAYTPRQLRRLSVRPGITGPWQISEARREPIHQNMQYDLYYLKYQSFALDVRLIAQTFLIMFRLRTRRRELEPVRPALVRQAVEMKATLQEKQPAEVTS